MGDGQIAAGSPKGQAQLPQYITPLMASAVDFAPSLVLKEWRGALVLEGTAIDDAVRPYISRIEDHIPFHITLLTKAEYRAVGRPSLPQLDVSHIYFLGPGSVVSHVHYLGSGSIRPAVRWLVVVWNHGNIYRKSLGLQRKDFHVTLTKQDEHDVDKGLMTMDGGEPQVLDFFTALGEDAMDHVLANKITPMQSNLAVHMVQAHPESYKAYIRLGDATTDSEPKTSMLAYAQALRLDPSLTDYVSKRLLRLSSSAAWGPVVTKDELAIISSHSLESLLLKPWNGEITHLCRDRLWPYVIQSRERSTYMGMSIPRFFSWIYPHRLAGMSTPRDESDINMLQDMGITTVLTLTLEEPLDPAWFKFKSIRNIYIPLENYGRPTLAEMDLIYDHFIQDEDGRWLVHCGGGKGRAGTVLACLMAMLDYHDDGEALGTPRMDKTTAIREIRSLRPGSIESTKQEQFVGDWLSHRWSVQNSLVDHSELVTELETEVNRDVFPSTLTHTNVGFCFLVGLPGSGKSWVAQAIAKRRAGPTIIISQDETRSRRSCENAIGQRHEKGTLVILDCCNPSAASRKEWLSLISVINPSVIAVYFDYPKDVCERRVNARLGHATIRAGRGSHALDHMSAQLGRPQLSEGFGAVMKATSFYAARQAAYLLGGPATITKFPRTAHIIDLGASTSDDIVPQHEMQEMKGHFVVEEKIDGANMGFSLDWDDNVVAQNRSHYVSAADHAQFRPLATWLERHGSSLRRVLDRDPQYPERYVLYGEWMVARHSIGYTRVPAHFVAFDLLDRLDGAFVSRRVLESALRGSGIPQVPLLLPKTTRLTRDQLLELAHSPSSYYDGPVEGVYVRTENEQGTLTVARGKIVRGDFLSGSEHWTKGPLVLNGVQEGGSDGD